MAGSFVLCDGVKFVTKLAAHNSILLLLVFRMCDMLVSARNVKGILLSEFITQKQEPFCGCVRKISSASLHAFICPGVEINLLHKWEVSGSNLDQET
jgi:hypothetical protein